MPVALGRRTALKRIEVLAVIGTRPEVVKMFPVIRELRRHPGRFRVKVCATAQHRDLLDSMLRTFGLRPEIDLNLMRQGQTLNGVLAGVANGLEDVLPRVKPDLVLAQGDTTTVLGAALASFHRSISFGHIEAGLRSFDLAKPFPEEANRLLVDRISDILFAPTQVSRKNLLRENIGKGGIFVTGNTSIDALLWAARRAWRFQDAALRALPRAPLVVVTLHRRESFGEPLREIFAALLEAARLFPHLHWVYPVHPNPNVRDMALKKLNHPRFTLTSPLGYMDFVHLMKRCSFIVTDSGGVQEEAPSLAKPVLVVREKTERTEFLGKGTRLVGVSGARLVSEIRKVVAAPPPATVFKQNPFGDGMAAQRTVQAIEYHFGLRPRRPVDFS